MISSEIHCSSDDGETNGLPPQEVELIYNEFIENWILLALRYLGLRFSKEDTDDTLSGMTLTDVISGWVGENWEC